MHRHSPCENERGRVRAIGTVAVEHGCDVNREDSVLVDHLVELVAELSWDLEKNAFELLIDLQLGLDFGLWKRLFNVFDPLARARGSPDVHRSRHDVYEVSMSARSISALMRTN